MNRTAMVACVVMGAMLVLTSGCGSTTMVYPGGPTVAGGIYTKVTSPAQYLAVALDKDAQPITKGESSNMAILGLLAIGDGGIDAAMKQGGITKVHHVDHTVQQILFAIYVNNKTTVYGE